MVKPSADSGIGHHALGEIELHRRKLGAPLPVNKQNAAAKTFFGHF